MTAITRKKQSGSFRTKTPRREWVGGENIGENGWKCSFNGAGKLQVKVNISFWQAAVILPCEGPQKIRVGVKGSYVDAAAAHLFLNLTMEYRCAGFRSGIFFPVSQSPQSNKLKS